VQVPRQIAFIVYTAIVEFEMKVEHIELRYVAGTVLVAILAIGFVSAPAFAASPHFIGTPTIAKNPNFSLTAAFKEAGLANVASEVFLSSSGGTAVLQCVGLGGNAPPPKLVTFGPLQGQITFVQPNNGQLTASVTIGSPLLPSASQICPNANWSLALLRLTYDNVVLHTQQNGVDVLTFNFGSLDP
jgi:hypothetical protein